MCVGFVRGSEKTINDREEKVVTISVLGSREWIREKELSPKFLGMKEERKRPKE